MKTENLPYSPLRKSDPKLNNVKISKTKLDHYVGKNERFVDSHNLLVEQLEKEKNDENSKKVLLTYISEQNDQYLGVTNDSLIRMGIGLNRFANGNVFIGEFTSDKMNSEGVFVNINSSDQTRIEIFCGNWKENKKEKGIYFYFNQIKDQNIDQYNIMDSSFDLYFGEFDDHQNFSNGLFIKYSNEYFKVYKGKYLYNSGIYSTLKHDKECIFYSGKENRIYFGEIDNDDLKEGKILLFNKEGKFSTRHNIKLDENGELMVLETFHYYKYQEELEEFKKYCDEFLELEIKKVFEFGKMAKFYSNFSMNDYDSFRGKMEKLKILINSHKPQYFEKLNKMINFNLNPGK